jgi:cytochrome c553
MKFRFTTLFTSSLLILIVIQVISWGCKTKNVEGEKLAKTYCASCHQFPEPSLLPKNVWQLSTLPYMGIMMGIDDEIKILEKPLSDYAILRPSAQMISNDDWEKIKEYYLSNAPKTLEMPQYADLEPLNNLFDIQNINVAVENPKIPNFTALKIDTLNNKIFAGDQYNRVIWIIDQNGKPLQTLQNQNALTNVDLANAKYNKYILTFIGTTTQANPDVAGSAEEVEILGNTSSQHGKILPNLERPLEVIAKNLDENSDNELISCEFGFKNGGLTIWKKDLKGKYQKQVLSSQTGSTKVIVTDFDGDKKEDILALFAQGDERIVVYLNKGNLKFEEKLLLRFPSIYGSSSFDVADMDKDGKKDIVYTAGDNADFSTILKPYHGVYIFKNQGNINGSSSQFKQTHFFQQNGATKVIPSDFDNDGDMDLVSIALFPDTDHRPMEGFIYFENTGSQFLQKTLNINHLGRWSVMDAADIDHDGDIDIVLGSHPVAKFPAGFDQEWKKGSGLLILRNNTKK